MRPYAGLLAAALALTAVGCATANRSFSGELKYKRTAEGNIKAGEEEFKRGNYADAEKFFDYTKNRFPFSPLAATGELRAADSKFEQERYLEAADAYQRFAKLHPNNEAVDRAVFRAGFCLYKQGPTDFLVFPPSYELDLHQVRAAVTQLEEFVKAYPSSQYLPEAKKILADGKDELAENDWYAANFYARRRRWAGVAGRLETLIKDYPGTRHETEAMMKLAETYLEMKERFRAQQTLQKLIAEHPADSRRVEAEKLLASIR
jgi:outer membrane protein assembly factor BamD